MSTKTMRKMGRSGERVRTDVAVEHAGAFRATFNA
jgi:hypothetical protein